MKDSVVGPVLYKQKPNSTNNLSRYLLEMFCLSLSYFILARIGLLLAIPPGYAAAVWPASGIALFSLLFFGKKLWPGVLLGSFLANVSVQFELTNIESFMTSSLIGLGLGLGASLQAVIAVLLIERSIKLDTEMLKGKKVILFLLLGGPLACLINASIGPLTLWYFGAVEKSQFFYTWLNWWVGDTIGVLLMVPLLLVWFGVPAKVWRPRKALVTIPLIISLIVLASVFIFAQDQEKHQMQKDFDLKAINFGDNLEKKLLRNIEVLYSIQGLFNSFEPVSRQHFSQFVQRSLERNSSIQALSFNKFVQDPERDSFVETTRAQGLQYFELTELDSSGQLVKAQKRQSYVVVNYIEPLSINKIAVGFDINSSAERKKAIDLAKQTHQLVVTEPVVLVQDHDGNKSGLLFLLAVHRPPITVNSSKKQINSLQGFVIEVIDVNKLLQEVFKSIKLHNIYVTLHDVSNSTNIKPLASYVINQQGQAFSINNVAQTNIESRIQWSKTIAIDNLQWQLGLQASATYEANHHSWDVYAVLIGGFIISALLGSFLLILSGNLILDKIRMQALSNEINQHELTELQLQHANFNLEKLTKTDPLTDVHNRRSIIEIGKRFDAEINRYQETYSVMMIDIDYFKKVNDTFGHNVGDNVLKIVSKNIQHQLRELDFLVRWGGEEFVVLAKSVGVAETDEMASRICDAIGSKKILEVGVLTISIGVAFSKPNKKFEDILLDADKALYRAKQNGRNRVEFD